MNLEPRFDSIAAFLQMDGHGGYIWAAYGLTLVVLVVNLWLPRMARQRFVAAEKPLAEQPFTGEKGRQQ